MEPEGSVSNSQELSTCPYFEPDLSSPHHPIPTLKIHSYGITQTGSEIELGNTSVMLEGFCLVISIPATGISTMLMWMKKKKMMMMEKEEKQFLLI
jgi:hypothetical protein